MVRALVQRAARPHDRQPGGVTLLVDDAIFLANVCGVPVRLQRYIRVRANQQHRRRSWLGVSIGANSVMECEVRHFGKPSQVALKVCNRPPGRGDWPWRPCSHHERLRQNVRRRWPFALPRLYVSAHPDSGGVRILPSQLQPFGTQGFDRV